MANYLPKGDKGVLDSDCRRSLRRSCLRREVVADYDPNRPLDRGDFRWVTFKDLSAHGVAFLTSEKPATEKVVIVLGNGPICIARVVRTKLCAISSIYPDTCGTLCFRHSSDFSKSRFE